MNSTETICSNCSFVCMWQNIQICLNAGIYQCQANAHQSITDNSTWHCDFKMKNKAHKLFTWCGSKSACLMESVALLPTQPHKYNPHTYVMKECIEITWESTWSTATSLLHTRLFIYITPTFNNNYKFQQ